MSTHNNQPLPLKKVNRSIYIPVWVIQRIQRQATKENRSFNNMAAALLIEALKDR